MSEWYEPLMRLDSEKFIESIKSQSTEDLSRDVVPYSSPNIAQVSDLYLAAETKFGKDIVSSWTILHWVVFRLMLLRDELQGTRGGPDVARLQRERDAFKNSVITWFRDSKLPTHQVVISMTDLWTQQQHRRARSA